MDAMALDGKMMFDEVMDHVAEVDDETVMMMASKEEDIVDMRDSMMSRI
jgi:hypothetical protein